jgi:EmrB/QacA subfamily drug resistance transporter
MNEKVDNESNAGWWTLILVSLGVFILSIDISFLNVAITNLVHDLHTNFVSIQNIIIVYTLVLASLTLLCGELQKVFGRKRTFLIGAVIFGIGTLIAALSINSTMLLLGWSILEGIGAALMMVSASSIVVGSYSGERRAYALGLLSSMSAGAAVLGPFVGGFLTTYFTWRYAFGLEFVIILIILLFSRSIVSFPKTLTWRDINIVGALNSAIGILLFVYGFILLNNPTTQYLSPYFIITGIILLIVFYLNQRNRIKNDEHPLIDVRIFQDYRFDLGNMTRIIISLISGGIIFIVPVFVQTVLGFSALTTGLLFAALAAPRFIMAYATGFLSKRFQPRYIISFGFLIALIGSIYLISTFSTHTTILQLVLGMASIGFGVGIIFPSSSYLLFTNISRDKQPDASAAMNTLNNLSTSMGTAILGLILLMGTYNALSVLKLIGGITNAFYAIAIMLFIGIIISQFIPPYKLTDNKT